MLRYYIIIVVCPFYRGKFIKKVCILTNKKPNPNFCFKEFWKCSAYGALTISPKVLDVRKLDDFVEKEIERYNGYLQRLQELFAEGDIDYSTYAYLHERYRDRLGAMKKALNLRQTMRNQLNLLQSLDAIFSKIF